MPPDAPLLCTLIDALPKDLVVPTRMLPPGAAKPIDAPGLPAWVRGGTTPDDAHCLMVEHAGELPLALAKAQRRTPDRPMLLQAAVEGPVVHAAAFQCGVDFVIAGLCEASHLPGLYRVPMGWMSPPGLTGSVMAQVIDLCRTVGRALPRRWGACLLEIVLAADGPRLADALLANRHPEDLAWTLRAAYGIDLDAAASQVAAGRRPQVSPSRGMAAGIRWLPSRSGVVRAVSGLEAARAVPGIHSAEIFARPGDTLGHVQDLAGRARTARVRAVGTTPARVREALDAAAERIRIECESLRA